MIKYGTRKDVKGGVVFTSEQTNEGFVYKDEKAFLDKEGICYISETTFTHDANNNGELLLTPDNVGLLTSNGGISTYHDIVCEIYEYLQCYEDMNTSLDEYAVKFNIGKFAFKSNFVEYLAEQLFYDAEWACINTYLNQIDLFEQLECFIENYTKKEEKD